MPLFVWCTFLCRPVLICDTDHETAQSAVRNLHNVDVGGRPLRIDLADSDPFLEGKTTVRGELVDGGETRAQWRERERDEGRTYGPRTGPGGGPENDAFLRTIPQGVPVPPGKSPMDMISENLGSMNPAQLIEVLAQMKVSCKFSDHIVSNGTLADHLCSDQWPTST